jgi:hypothetical protein
LVDLRVFQNDRRLPFMIFLSPATSNQSYFLKKGS